MSNIVAFDETATDDTPARRANVDVAQESLSNATRNLIENLRRRRDAALTKLRSELDAREKRATQRVDELTTQMKAALDTANACGRMLEEIRSATQKDVDATTAECRRTEQNFNQMINDQQTILDRLNSLD